MGVGLGAGLVIAMSGVIAALGDTLFPATSLGQGMASDFSPAANFLVRLRVFHPVLAVLGGIYFVTAALMAGLGRKDILIRKVAWLVSGLVLVQVALGVVNLILLAPVWMQLTHLFSADLVWVCFVILTAETTAVEDN